MKKTVSHATAFLCEPKPVPGEAEGMLTVVNAIDYSRNDPTGMYSPFNSRFHQFPELFRSAEFVK